MVNKLVASVAWNMFLCMIVGCGSKSGRDKGLYFARFTSYEVKRDVSTDSGLSCGSSLLVQFSAPRVLSPGTPVFPSPKRTLLNCNSIGNRRTFDTRAFGSGDRATTPHVAVQEYWPLASVTLGKFCYNFVTTHVTLGDAYCNLPRCDGQKQRG